jgi:hypothetical protein
MTTKKDFIQAAKVISEISDITEKTIVCNNFIEIFKKQNVRFDAKKFSLACGLNY